MPAIEVKNLCISRGDRKLFQGLSFHVDKGSFTVLSGPSGGGKSSILLAIQGLLGEEEDSHASGEIRVNGNLVTLQKRADSMSSYSGCLLQNVDAQIVNQICGDELAFGMENRALPPSEMKNRIEKYSELFKLDADKQITKLSGGQKQRLLIAACICTGHDVLLLDEPFANLDASSAKTLLSIIKECCDNGVTIFCIEHRLEEVRCVADCLLWLENGELTRYDNDQIDAFAVEKAKALNVPLVWNETLGAELLSLKELSLARGKHHVLSNFSIRFDTGTTKLLLGENGCGKTSLMRLLCGLARKREFSADEFIYKNVSRLKYLPYRALRRSVGFVFQNPVHQLFMKTVEEEILLRCPDIAKSDQVMEVFAIAHLKNRHPYSLSMGEKRRVCVAAVAASGVPLILLDEPTIGQDYLSLRKMALSLNSLQKETHTSYLISTHDKQAAELFGGNILQLPLLSDNGVDG